MNINENWKPNNGDIYFTIEDDNEIYKRVWLNCEYDIERYENGNCFKTKDEAKIKIIK